MRERKHVLHWNTSLTPWLMLSRDMPRSREVLPTCYGRARGWACWHSASIGCKAGRGRCPRVGLLSSHLRLRWLNASILGWLESHPGLRWWNSCPMLRLDVVPWNKCWRPMGHWGPVLALPNAPRLLSRSPLARKL